MGRKLYRLVNGWKIELLFSESFSLGLKYLPSLLVDSAEDSDLTHFFGDLTKLKPI